MEDAYWQYRGQRVEPRDSYGCYSSEFCSTTEDATETTDSRGFQDMYGTHPAYRVRRTYNPAQYYYPIRRRVRQRGFRTPSQMKLATQPYESVAGDYYHTYPQRRMSSRQPLVWPQWPIRYSYPTPTTQHPKTSYRINQKSIPRELTYNHHDLDRRHAQASTRKMRKPLIKKRLDWESSTSAGGKSVQTAQSRLSVDVSQEMAAVNRDFETLFTLYGSTNNDGHRSDRKHIGNERLRSFAKQKHSLVVDRPPSVRLPATPYHNLEPRLPSTLQESIPSDTLSEKNDTDQLEGSTMWSSMLQDLINRGIIDKLDCSSLAKLKKSPKDVKMGNLQRANAVEAGPTDANTWYRKLTCRKDEPLNEVKKRTSSSLSGETIVLQDLDNTVLLDHQNNSSRKIAPSTSTASFSKMSNPVERPKMYIPVSKVDGYTNWRTKLEEFQGMRNECQRCHDINLGAGSGDKAIVEGKSTNTERSEIEEKHTLKNEAAVTPSGDPEVTNWMRIKTGEQSGSSPTEKSNNSSTSFKTVNIGSSLENVLSQITVNSGITDQTMVSTSSSLSSSNATCIDGEMLATSETKEGYTVTIEDVEEEELPLRGTSETTSISSRGPSVKHFRNALTSQLSSSVRDKCKVGTMEQGIYHDLLGRECSSPGRFKDSTQGGGDNTQANEEVLKQELKSFIGNMTIGDDINNKLKRFSALCKNNHYDDSSSERRFFKEVKIKPACENSLSEGTDVATIGTFMKTTSEIIEELKVKVSKSTTQLDTDICLDIIRKVTEMMRQQDPIINPELKDVAHLKSLLTHRKNHMDHIIKEINYISHTDSVLKSPLGAGWTNPSALKYLGSLQSDKSIIQGGT